MIRRKPVVRPIMIQTTCGPFPMFKSGPARKPDDEVAAVPSKTPQRHLCVPYKPTGHALSGVYDSLKRSKIQTH